MDRKRPNIYQIAKEAEVSIGTVSRVINGKDRVAPKTRARILAVAEKYGYRPSAAARGLATKRTHTIMLLVSDIANVYFAEMAKEISRHSRRHNYRVVLGDSDETVEQESEYLAALGDAHVDGAIVAPLTTSANISHYLDLAKRRFPLVLLDTEIEGAQASCVRVDNFRGAEMAVEYLAGKGHTRIAFVCGNVNFQTNRLRYDGFRSGLEKNGCSLQNEYLILNQEFLAQEGFCGVQQLLALPNRPTAIFATTDLMAMACIRTIRRAGLRVPDDIAVVGFDDLAISPYLDIPLTTIHQPKGEVAARAVELLLEKIEKGREAPTVQHILIEPKLVVRDSA